jgi:hypothetical protein
MIVAYVLTFVLAVSGLLLFIAGVGGVWNRRPLWGSIKGLTGLLLLTAGVLVLMISMNLYTYHRLTAEAPVAEIRFEQIAPQRFRINLLPVGDVPQWYELRGDEWQLDARMIKWQGVITLLNVDPVYRLDRLSGRYRIVEQDKRDLRTIYDLGVSHGLDLWTLAQQYKTLLPWVDAVYGSAVYMPMMDKASYQVTIANSGLVVRPGNEQAQQAVKTWR